MLEAGPPITMLEAVSHGASVLGSDIPAQVEALGDGGPGHRVFSAGDPDSLASALGQALSDPAGDQTAAGAWREGVLREHSWDDAAEATALLYEALVNQ
jgi:glycosyltransferase involved in cell wall biosynthesis